MNRFISLLTALFFVGAAYAQTSVRIAQGPYLQEVTPDGFTVVWTTTTDAAVWVETAPQDNTHFYGTERPKYYDSHIGRRRTGRLHRVRVEGLEPGTTYRYRIMQQGVVTDEGNKRMILGDGYGNDILSHNHFLATTLNPHKPSVECWVVNDIHAHDSIFSLLLKDVDKQRPDFVCFNGDMLSSMESEEQLFAGYMASTSKLLATTGIPLFVARGNHEGRGKFAPSYTDYFPTTTGQTYYSFRQGPVNFIVLDCGEDKPDSDIRYYGLSTSDAYREQQTEWLKREVASDAFRSAPVRVVVIHMPPNTERGWHGEREIARLFVPILEKAGVDLMICGHTHRYAYITDGSRGTSIPILINSNNDKLIIRADSNTIQAKVMNTSGEVIRQHEIAIPKNR